MTPYAEQAIAYQLQQVKDLYAELFLLLVQSIAEDPLEEATGAVDASIEQLMHSIDSHMQGLRETIADGGPLEPSLNNDVKQFEMQLRIGLEKMVEAVRRRTDDLAATRDQLKQRLQSVQLKGKGAKGYRRRTAPSARLIEISQ